VAASRWPDRQPEVYRPADAATAECPRCGAVVPSLAYPSPGLDLAMLRHRCPTCRGWWSELRNRDGIRRAWDPAEAPPA
jgi:hypothetical protein